MKRRQWIQTVLATPAAVAVALPGEAQAQQQSPPAARNEFASIETAGSTERVGEPVLKFLSKDEFKTLERLADTIFPALSGKPGALEAGVPAFLDFLLLESPSPRQKLYREGLAQLNSGKPLSESLKAIEEPWTYREPADPLRRFLREAKEDILEATFNSREWIEARKSTGRRGGSGTYYLAVD